MSKEMIIIVAAIILLLVAIYTIGNIGRLPVSRTYKITLYCITVIFPVLGLLLMWNARRAR